MMQIQTLSFEQRVKENIKNYTVKQLLPFDLTKEYFELMDLEFGLELLLTDRHGLHEIMTGDWTQFHPDVIDEPGIRIRVQNRTVGHLYVRNDKVEQSKADLAKQFVNYAAEWMSRMGQSFYLQKETAAHMEELELSLNQEKHYKYSEKEDALTGVYNKTYLENRIQVLDRAEVAPVAVINANINDWKFVYDHFGVDESDSLIQLAASILMKEAKPEYVIGRVGGDDFVILIPLVEDGEAEDFCARVQKECSSYDENSFLLSIAMGISIKTNVEEKINDKLSDAEYEMFNNKLELKNMPGYQERLWKNVKKD